MVALVGRKSVAGVVSWGLGVLNIFVAIGAVATFLTFVGSLVVPGFPTNLTGDVQSANISFQYDGGVPLPFLLLGACVACSFTWLTLHTLRRIFRSVNEGRAFELENVGRLRVMGAGLAGLQVTNIALHLMTAEGDGFDPNLGAWLGVLIVFMLAEVFRQGAVMRDDYEATV